MNNIRDSVIAKWVIEATKVASQVLSDKGKLKDLLGKATGMLSHLPSAAGDAKTLIRMIKASTSGEYDGLHRANLLLIVGAIVYLVMPFDIFPDPALVDDAVIIAWVVRKVKADLDRFLAWEEAAAATSVETEHEAPQPIDVPIQSFAPVHDEEHPIASFFLTEPVLRQLILQAIPPKVRFMLRDAQVSIHEAEIHVKLALNPVGSIKYAIIVPVGKVDIGSGELKLTVANTTSGAIASRLASSIKQMINRKLESSPLSAYISRSGDDYTIALGAFMRKAASRYQEGFVLADFFSLRVAQEEGKVSLSFLSTLDQVAAVSFLAGS